MKVNVLNVCTPSAEEQKEIAAALARIPKQPLFGSDFEISHGVSTLTDAPNFLQPGQGAQISGEPSVARYVRIRREFSVQALFSSVQYSFSNDGQNMVETLVLHVRDPKELIQVSMEDSASAISSVATMVAANTPVSRIRLERFGKSSVALARCTGSENGPRPIKARMSRSFAAPPRCSPTIAGCWAWGTRCPPNWRRFPGPELETSDEEQNPPRCLTRRTRNETKSSVHSSLRV